jgi:hypothetical protein
MAETASAAVVLVLLLGSSALGILVRPLLSERHRSLEMSDFLQFVATMLITSVALVLGLLTTSVKVSFDKVGNDLKGFSIAVIRLDQSLREWGSATEPERALLCRLDLRRLDVQDPLHRRLAADCLIQLQRLMQLRWQLIEEGGSSITTPFYVIVVFWLVIVFASFGLTAPRNALSYTAIALGALSIASVIFVILELDTPFDGLIVVSSQPLRSALDHLDR